MEKADSLGMPILEHLCISEILKIKKKYQNPEILKSHTFSISQYSTSTVSAPDKHAKGTNFLRVR
jgi:hypothetical protein